MRRPVRVLVVDDSPSMQAALSRILESDPDIEVVGAAPEPHTARAMIKELEPDVLTLDVEMPGMDGLSFLERIMRLRPMPVVMCSTLTARGTEVTIEALRLGAVDCIAKPCGNPLEIERNGRYLCATVKAAARSRVRPLVASPPSQRVIGSSGSYRDMVIAIGASTGGVEALFALIGSLPRDCPPVLIVQHMPAGFTSGFAERLDKHSAVKVREARDGDMIDRGSVHIAPGGGSHMRLAGRTIRLTPGDLVGGHRPSVDVLFRSVAERGSRSVGALLTGMGQDGASGLLAMRRAGARTFGQSADTCVVYGMPRAAFQLGAVERQVRLSAMPEAILGACRHDQGE